MAILKIARMGHPVLRRPAAPVEEPIPAVVRQLAQDMIETMVDSSGVGLAAPQVHVGWRVIVFRVPAERAGGENLDVQVLVNPVVEPLSEETQFGWEGCLSIPGLRGAVPRYNHIRYRGLALDGSVVEREARGFHARVVQHECDHLDGVLYLDRMNDLRFLSFTEEMKYFGADSVPKLPG
ncbi:peptide deformylase [Nitrospirillum sp. BR 11163]|uniref:peptide deformylase n=1 Tax=Nitrospirillum sp. BR 11163 TaxID=3104323 RepID=UPI002AFE6C13|nr:peptide deformylase [Nitrospirillum sp. BR 11163]MEA1676750.1 peptide deformylase [Nitrospirillum sp. BR 11163]